MSEKTQPSHGEPQAKGAGGKGADGGDALKGAVPVDAPKAKDKQ